MPVHPHMRGDNTFWREVRKVGYGSPPHAWGQSWRWGRAFSPLRFTPTCVGTIFADGSERTNDAVHPHMRGDNGLLRPFRGGYRGSPPHAWGQCVVVVGGGSHARFTPTCVGTMRLNPRFPPTYTVHPHMRGDNASASIFLRSAAGSPPHAWGQFRRGSGQPPDRRFTPTCVGTMLCVPVCMCIFAVHPHMRGDNVYAKCVHFNAAGSPPHAWGQSAQI